MTVIRENGKIWAHGLGWTDISGGGKAVSFTVCLTKKEMRWLKKFIKDRDGRDTVTQDDADGLLLACLSCGLECWAMSHGFQKKEMGGTDALREYTGDK